MSGKMVYYVIEGAEPERKLTDPLRAAIAKAVGFPVGSIKFKQIEEEDRPPTNAAMWKLVAHENVLGVTDLTLSIYTRAAKGGKFFQLDVDGDVKKVTVELEKPKSDPNPTD